VDAVCVKEDVLNRLGGNISMPNGQMVCIGFGKVDSLSASPSIGADRSSSTKTYLVPRKKLAHPSMSSVEAQLQSMLTRALWIRSIPSTTTLETVISVFSPYGPIKSACVLTYKICGFINFEHLDNTVQARKALNGCDMLGSDVGTIRIGFAKVPVKNGQDGIPGQEEALSLNVQGVGDLSIHQENPLFAFGAFSTFFMLFMKNVEKA